MKATMAVETALPTFCMLGEDARNNALEWFYRLASVTFDEHRPLGRKMTAIAFFQELREAICGGSPLPAWSATTVDRTRDVVMQVERFGKEVRFGRADSV